MVDFECLTPPAALVPLFRRGAAAPSVHPIPIDPRTAPLRTRLSGPVARLHPSPTGSPGAALLFVCTFRGMKQEYSRFTIPATITL